MTEEQDSGFRVKDRRRFDESGNRRSDDDIVDDGNATKSVARDSAARGSVGRTSHEDRSQPNGSQSQGYVRPQVAKGQSAAKPAEIKSQAASVSNDFVVKDSPALDEEETALDYSSFLLSLATQAMVQLGEMPPPPGVDIPKNIEAAKHTIDVIEMLVVKTRGNLSETEKKLTDEILHALRLGYVRSKG